MGILDELKKLTIPMMTRMRNMRILRNPVSAPSMTAATKRRIAGTRW